MFGHKHDRFGCHECWALTEKTRDQRDNMYQSNRELRKEIAVLKEEARTLRNSNVWLQAEVNRLDPLLADLRKEYDMVKRVMSIFKISLTVPKD